MSVVNVVGQAFGFGLWDGELGAVVGCCWSDV